MYGATTRYFGAGHGFAGNAHALLGRPDLLDDAAGLAAGFARIVLDQAIGTHETANWPPYADGPLEIAGSDDPRPVVPRRAGHRDGVRRGRSRRTPS